MNKYLAGVRYKLLLALIFFCFTGCFKDLTKVTIVYSNDFEAGSLNGITQVGWLSNTSFGVLNEPKITNFNGSKALGRFNNAGIEVKLDGLPDHDAIRVEMDLYLHDQWKNDLWQMSYDGSSRLISGFSNDSTVMQSYPNWIGNGSFLSPAGANAQEIYLPGTCSWKSRARGSSHYKMISTAVHTNTTFVFRCSDAGGPVNDTCTRSWSIDNLKISVLKN